MFNFRKRFFAISFKRFSTEVVKYSLSLFHENNYYKPTTFSPSLLHTHTHTHTHMPAAALVME